MSIPWNYDLLIFDMEDALVDQSVSLCTALSRAVDTYLTVLIGVGPDEAPLFTPDEVRSFQEAMDFESDEAVLEALLVHALDLLPEDLDEGSFEGADGREMLDAVRTGHHVRATLAEIRARKNLPGFQKSLRHLGGGKRGLPRLRTRNRWMVMAEGHIMMDNLVRRVLAEVFLGEDLFQKEFGRGRQFYLGDGTLDLETGWLTVQDLTFLRQRCPLATLTSRSQAEAQAALEVLGIASLIEVVVGRDSQGMGVADAEEVDFVRSLGIGATLMADYAVRVTEAIERVRAQEGIENLTRVGWIGNCAREGRNFQTLKERYRLTCIGVAFGSDRKTLSLQRERGADLVVTEPSQLLRVLPERPKPRGPESSRHPEPGRRRY
ncbi:hypothetical protein KBD49_00880 [Myxococcota bacterium]|nr:hypothetical protein [Myxococcota bacterium]